MLDRLKGVGLIYLLFAAVFSFGSLLYGSGVLTGFLLVTVLFVILFLPGYLFTELLFPKETGAIERIAYSVGFGFSFFLSFSTI